MTRALTTAAALLALLLLPAAAAALPLPLPSPKPPIVRLADGGCPTGPPADGCFDPATRTIYLSRRTADWNTLDHEFFHAEDFDGRIDDGERHAISCTRAMRPRCGWPWWNDEQPLSVAETTADAYSMCQHRGANTETRWATAYGYQPRSRADHRALCRLLGRALSD